MYLIILYIKAVRTCKEIYLESYTSILGINKA